MSQRDAEPVVDKPRSGDAHISKRSRKGCPECRKRKVKCDEKRPNCGQCQRSGRLCHISDTLFKPHALSSEAAVTQAAPPTNSWHAKSAQIHFEGSDDEEPQAGENLDGGELDLSRPPTLPQWLGSTPDLVQPNVGNGANVARQLPWSSTRESLPLMNDSMNNARDASSLIETEEHNFSYSSPTAPPAAETQPVRISSLFQSPSATSPSAVDRLEESFFVRYFSEKIAPWFDIVNFQRYFGHECIVLIRENSLLRFAMCALSAKQLGQSSTSNAPAFHNAAQTSIAQHLLRDNFSFLWYGAKYYDKAIKTLARQITPREPQVALRSPSETSSVSFPQSDMMTRADGEDPIVRLLATCLLIQYENLSGNTKGWTGHLNGFTKLLALLDDGSLFYTNPWSQKTFDAKSQRALRAAFWWYVVNDLEESFAAQRAVRVDLHNVSLWRHMGLHMHDSGEPIDLDASGTPDAPPHLQEDLLSFALIRLVSKLVNALAVSQSREGTVYSPSCTASGLVLKDDVANFQKMENDLDRWMSLATAAFHADSTWRSSDMGSRQNPGIFGAETWYSHSFRAVTMLYYHMARTLLLINQPPSLLMSQSSMSGRSFDLLKVLRNIEQQIRNHAAEIISITKGMYHDGAARVRALQPLYVAGRSLTTTEDRRHLTEMIRSIQDDFGLVSEYRVEHLIQEWGITFEELGLAKKSYERRISLY